MQDDPKKRAAQLFLDIIRNEVVPYISVAEESKGKFTTPPIAIRKTHNDLSLTLATWGFLMLVLEEFLRYPTQRTLNEKHFFPNTLSTTFAISPMVDETTQKHKHYAN